MRNLNQVFGILGTIKYYAFIETYYRLGARFRISMGVAEKTRHPPLIVSLTSIPARFKKLPICLESLLTQSLKPDRLILWLEVDPKTVPASVGKLTKRGLEIRHCQDIGPYKKLIYSLKEFPNSLIVTADDDIIYPKFWLQELFDAYRREPEYIHCHRAHYMERSSDGRLQPYRKWRFGADGITGPSLYLFPTGAGGVLYQPGCFAKEVLNEKLFMQLCPTADDIWYKAMSIKMGVPCKKIHPYHKEFTQIKGTQQHALWRENTMLNKNDQQIKAVFEYFNLYSSLDA